MKFFTDDRDQDMQAWQQTQVYEYIRQQREKNEENIDAKVEKILSRYSNIFILKIMLNLHSSLLWTEYYNMISLMNLIIY